MEYRRVLYGIAVVGIALLGVGLIFNPLYFYPDGGGVERTYHVEQIENEVMASQALGLSEDVLGCGRDRPCALESQVLEEGSVELDARMYDDESSWYSVVRIGNGTYIPTHQVGDNETTLTLEEVSEMEAVKELAVPADEQREEVQKAVETGSVTVYDERIDTFERHQVLEHEDDYYYHKKYEGVGTHWTRDGGLTLVRATLFLIGSGLVAASGWHFRKLYD